MARLDAQADGGRFHPDGATTAELLDRLVHFAGSPGEFLADVLAAQCRLAAAFGGAIVRPQSDGRAEILALFPSPPPGSPAPPWLAQAGQAAAEVVKSGVSVVKPLRQPDELYGQPAGRHLIMVPLKNNRGVHALAVFLVANAAEAALAGRAEWLELTAGLLDLYEVRTALRRRDADVLRLRTTVELLAAVNEQKRFTGAAMAMCNEVADLWKCERVSLGFLKGRYVQLEAMSHTEKFSRKMKIVQDIEAAMEECIDQDIETVYPPADGATYVSRSAGDLSTRHGPTCVVSLPLRIAGEPIAVLTIERPADKPPDLAEIESLRLACELAAPRLADIRTQDRWSGAKVAADVRVGLASLIGPKHTWLKVAAAGVFIAAVVLTFARGDYRVGASFVLEATEHHVIPAPFESYVKTVAVKPGDRVVADETVLARLDDSELRLRLAMAKATRLGHQTRSAAAMRDGETAEAKIASADAAEVTAEIRLLESHIEKASLTSPISGYVLRGDLDRRVGSPVRTGEVLFEVAPLEFMRAELFVGEDQIADVWAGQEGALAVVYPQGRVRFVVERIHPVAEVADGRNVFRIRARLLERPQWMRPGMEGVAKIQVGRRRYVWIWTRQLTNWLRMKLWF